MSERQVINSIHESINVEINPLVIQLKEFGYDNIYSRRVFYYLHPEDIDEALNYMSFENGIIQHIFIKDRRNISNKKCYICGENEEIHLKKDLNNNISNNEKIEEEKSEKNDTDSNQIKKSINNINTNNDLKSSSFSFGNKTNVNKNYNNNESFTQKEEYTNHIKNSFNSIEEVETNINNLENEISNPNIEKNKDKEMLEIIKSKIKLKPKEEKKECEICNEIFIINEYNKLEKCGHAFCSGCWYDSLSVKIKENKLASIKCLDYKCQEKLPGSFIYDILKEDNDLLKIYKRYKLELEVIENPNKKLCPYPNCDSYLELKDIHIKDVSCLNKHKFCFLCLKKPHGSLPCNENGLDKSVLEYAMNNFVKKCPKCNIIIEKNDGCNHITCTKCGYQWCWLCNGQYNENHFNEGKCKGFQFYQPKNDYDIKLAMEGKINADELSNSQRQFDDRLDDDIITEPILRIRHIEVVSEIEEEEFSDEKEEKEEKEEEEEEEKDEEKEEKEENIEPHASNEVNEEQIYENENCIDKIGLTFLFIIFGNCYINLMKFDNHCCITLSVYLLFFIAFFFQLIFLNIVSLILILIFIGYKKFIFNYKTLDDIYLKKVNLILFTLILWTFCVFYIRCKKILDCLRFRICEVVKNIAFCPYLIITTICFFPLIIIINIFGMICTLIDSETFSSFFDSLNDLY